MTQFRKFHFANTMFKNCKYIIFISENIDYFGKKTEMESLYTQLTASNYVVNGTVDSWFNSYTDWLSTTSDASVIAQIDGN